MSLNSKKYGKPSVKLKTILTVQKCFKRYLAQNNSIDCIRKSLDKGTIQMCGKPLKVYNYKNISLSFKSGKVPIRIYTPNRDIKLPIIIYMHGGSWIGGSIDTHDNLCRKLSRFSKAIVVSVGYRLAPEFQFPTALIDVYNVICWAYENANYIRGNKNKIALVGDSAGGNLTAAISHFIAKKGGPKINCQVLIYPSTNIYETNSESWDSLGEEVFLKKDVAEKFIAMYVPEKESRKNPYVSPLLAKSFKKIPPTLIITAEFDPLRDEGVAYYEALKEGKVDVNHIMVKGVQHGFITMDRIFNEAERTLKQIALYIKKYNKTY